MIQDTDITLKEVSHDCLYRLGSARAEWASMVHSEYLGYIGWKKLRGSPVSVFDDLRLSPTV